MKCAATRRIRLEWPLSGVLRFLPAMNDNGYESHVGNHSSRLRTFILQSPFTSTPFIICAMVLCLFGRGIKRLPAKPHLNATYRKPYIYFPSILCSLPHLNNYCLNTTLILMLDSNDIHDMLPFLICFSILCMFIEVFLLLHFPIARVGI